MVITSEYITTCWLQFFDKNTGPLVGEKPYYEIPIKPGTRVLSLKFPTVFNTGIYCALSLNPYNTNIYSRVPPLDNVHIFGSYS